MDRCALFVDASYALADGAMAVHGTRRRDSVSWNHAGLLTLLAGLAKDRTGLPVLRCYWYETAAEGTRTPEQDALAEMPGLKLRLVHVRPGRREGIETPLRRDLVTLAKNGAISDVFIASADEHLAEIVAEVQDLGLRVVILHISSDGGWTIPQQLRQECDDIVEISGIHLQPFVELIRGAEPAVADELRGHEMIGSRGSSAPDALLGPLPSQGRALAAPLAQGALYSSLDVQLPGDQLAASAAGAQPGHSGLGGPGSADLGASGMQPYAGAGQVASVPDDPAPIGPVLTGPAQATGAAQSSPLPFGNGQVGPAQVGPGPIGNGQVGGAAIGPAQMTGGPAQVGPAQVGPAQVGPAQVGPAPPASGYLNGAARGGAPMQQQTSGDGYLGSAHYGAAHNGLTDLAPGSGQNGISRAGYSGVAAHDGLSGHGGPISGGPISNGAPPGRSENGATTSYQAQPPMGYAAGPGVGQAGSFQVGTFQPADAQHQPAGSQGEGGRNGAGQYGPLSAGSSQAPAHQNGPLSAGSSQAPAHQNGAISPSAQQVGPPQNGFYQLGPVQHGLSYQNGSLQAGPAQPGPLQSGQGPSGGLQGPVQADPMRGSAQGGSAQAGLVQPGQVGPGQGASMYPAPVAPGLIPPNYGPMVGTVFPPQGQYLVQSQPALPPARAMQPAAIPLPEAVQAAHAEGFSFGESVGRDAPGLWLDAVLARKPRMPSDLEARLLQGSVLPIDSLLHDEVRHSLRRGFWDALEGVRR